MNGDARRRVSTRGGTGPGAGSERVGKGIGDRVGGVLALAGVVGALALAAVVGGGASVSAVDSGYIESNFDPTPYYVPLGTEPPPTPSVDGTGKFRTFCRPGAVGTFDPIVFPGQPATGHEHLFFGNTAVSPDSTYASLRTTGNSTCDGGPLNRTAYWVPSFRDGSGRAVTPSVITLYYSTTRAHAQVQSFPPGLRMIAGYSSQQTAAENSATRSWRCASSGVSTDTVPTGCAGSDDIIAEVYFPRCWDGLNTDSPNHRSHLAYEVRDPSTGQPGCPATHPVILAEITLIMYLPNVPGLHLSSDVMGGVASPSGSTLHADWFGAWDATAEGLWLDHCVRVARECQSSVVSPLLRLNPQPVDLPPPGATSTSLSSTTTPTTAPPTTAAPSTTTAVTTTTTTTTTTTAPTTTTVPSATTTTTTVKSPGGKGGGGTGGGGSGGTGGGSGKGGGKP